MLYGLDLAGPHDEVLAQKDQANAAFLLHGDGSARREKRARKGQQRNACRNHAGVVRLLRILMRLPGNFPWSRWH